MEHVHEEGGASVSSCSCCRLCRLDHPAVDRGAHAGHAASSGEGHEGHSGGGEDHAGHGTDHMGHETMFRKRFWIALATSLPVLFFSASIQGWLSYTAPTFAGSSLIVPLLSTFIFVYGGFPSCLTG